MFKANFNEKLPTPMPHFHTRMALFIVFCLLAFSCRQKSQPEGFRIEPGFTLSLVAAEPLLKDPVDLEFNEVGDALVLEMPGYPFEDNQSRIVVLKDGDDDGQFDERIVFVENLQLANSFMPYKKGVLVAAPPYLLFVHDENQDYKPEKVDTLMGGFATGNLQHNYNSLTLGLDNWIYAANGGNDGAPYWWNDTTTRMDLRGQDFRFNLETKRLERLGQSSGGFGLAMDEYGRLFETHNLTHLSHLVFPDRYLQGKQLIKESTLENISDHEENGLARIYPVGEQESRVNHPEQSGYFSGACGVTYYGGGALGEAYNHTVWVADVVLNLIHVDKITSSGSSFVASRAHDQRDFLASADRAFRPVNMAVGPEGAMYVVDMYRKVIEHPEWIPDDIEKTLDLAAGKDQGRIYRIEKADTKSSFDVSLFATPQGLVECLSHPNQWVRKTAHRLLLDLPVTSETASLLTSQLGSPNEFGRLHALWLLQVRAGLSDAALANALNDSIPAIRESALQMAESRLGTNPDLLTLCLSLMNDVDARVKMQAALSVSTLTAEQFEANREQVLNAVWMAAQKPGDAWNAAALTLAANSSAATLLVKLLADAEVESHPAELLMSLARASGHPASGLPASGHPASGHPASGTREGTQSILSALASTKVPGHVRQKIVLQLIDGMDISDSKSIEPLIRPLEQSGDAGMISALALMRNKLELPPSEGFLKLSRQALNKVLDKSLPDSARTEQLTLIELLPYKEKSDVLFSCLHHAEPLKLQENALRQLSKYNEKEIGHKVVEMWNELSPHTRRYASDLLLYIETHHDALLTGLEDGTINIGEMNFDLERRRTLLWWTDNEDTKRRAEKLFTDSGVTNRQEAIEKMKPALALTGIAANGAKVFETVCSNCHVYGSLGNEVGPVLTEIGRKSKETLLHDILDPNAAADPKYISHRLETADGMVHLGIVATETDKDITIKKIGGEKVTVSKADIKGFRSLGTSLMMEGLENSMTPQEMADLLAFLQNGGQGTK